MEDNELYLQFQQYNKKNPYIYELFKKYAFETISKSFSNFGAHTIIHRIRWYTEVESAGDAFKINNNYSAYYSRLFMEEFPQHNGFFRTRKVKGE